MDIKKIQQMLKLIPNNFPVCLEDLKEIFSQNEKEKRLSRKQELQEGEKKRV